MEDSFLQNQQPSLEQDIVLSSRFKFWYILGGVFVLGIILFALFTWHQKYTADHLIKYAPVDTAIYVTARNSFWPWEASTIKDVPLSHVFPHQELLDLSSHAALIKIPSDNDELDTVSIFLMKHLEAAVPFIENLPHTKVFGKNILVIASSKESLIKVDEVYRGTVFSLETQIDKNKLGRGLSSVYVSAGNLRSHLGKNDNLADKIYSYLLRDDLYLTFSKKGDRWIFSPNDSVDLGAPRTGLLVETLPADFNIFAAHINLAEIFQSWLAANEVFAETTKHNIANLEAIYDFDFSDVMQPLFNQYGDITIFNVGVNNALGFDYTLVFDYSSQEQLEAFEELVKVTLAQKLPREKTRVLPDGSLVIELVAETDVWQWSEAKISNGLAVQKLIEKRIGFEVAYLVADNKVYISSSADLISDMLSKKDISLERLSKRCLLPFSQDNVVMFNSNIEDLFDDILPAGFTILSGDPKQGLNGCIL